MSFPQCDHRLHEFRCAMSHELDCPEQRLTPRESEHLMEFVVEIAINDSSYQGRLVDESVTGVGVRFDEVVDVAVDTHVVVISGRNRRDAIVQRVWLDESGLTRLGLLWRAAQFR